MTTTKTTKRERISVTLYDNYNIDFDEYKNYYKEFCEDNEIDFDENDENDDNEVWDYINRDMEDFWDNLKYELKCFNNDTFVINGELGLWNGRPTIEPKVVDGLIEAIATCNTNSIEYLIVKQDGKNVYVTAIHHDGRNEFTISLLNDKGINAGENADLSKKCYHKNIPYIYGKPMKK